MSSKWSRALGVALIVFAVGQYLVFEGLAFSGLTRSSISTTVLIAAVETAVVAFLILGLWQLARPRAGAAFILAASVSLFFEAIRQLLSANSGSWPPVAWSLYQLSDHFWSLAILLLAIGLLRTRVVAPWIGWVLIASVVAHLPTGFRLWRHLPPLVTAVGVPLGGFLEFLGLVALGASIYRRAQSRGDSVRVEQAYRADGQTVD